MNILICCATPRELKVVKEEIKKLNLKQQLPLEYLCTGIGNHKTIFSLTKFLSEHREEKYFIVNIGVCGYVKEKIPLIQGGIVKHLSIEKETIVPIFLQLAPIKKLISSEIVVDDVRMLGGLEEEECFVEMESRGIELVAQEFQFPRLFLKVPIDRIGEETKKFDVEWALEQLRENIDYLGLVEKVLGYCEKIA